MNVFPDKVHGLFIRAHRELDEQFNGRPFIDIKFVHEFMDAIKVAIMKAGAEFEDMLENREAAKRRLSGMKDMPTSSKEQSDAQKARIQTSLNKQRMSE